MGYRSDVTFGVGFRSRDELIGFLTALKLTGDFDADYMADLSVIKDGDVWLLHGEYDDIKWYDGFAEVVNTSKLLFHASEMGHSTAFIRIGEDIEDTEEQYYHKGTDRDIYMWDYYRLVRSIGKPSSDGATPVMEMLGSDVRA